MFPIFIYDLCMQFPFGYLHSSAVTSYKDALALSHMQFCTFFSKFQSQVGKILITAININGPGLVHSNGAGLSRPGPGTDFLCDHDTLIIFRQSPHQKNAPKLFIRCPATRLSQFSIFTHLDIYPLI